MMDLKNNSTFKIFMAMILGMIAGVVVPNFMIATKFIGDIFLRLIQMTVVILVMGSVIEAVGSLNKKTLGSLGLKAFIGFAITTITACMVGIVAANLIMPGSGIELGHELTTTIKGSDDSLAKIITNFFPNNIISSIASGNTIQVIVFAILAGLAVSSINEIENNDSKILSIIKDMNKLIIYVINMIMRLAPLGIFSLLGWVVGNYGFAVILPLAKFLGTFALCSVIIITTFITVVALYVKVSPFALARKLTHMGIMAFTTTSSAVTLPTKMADSENVIGISKRVSRLINPLGMSLNSDGLALYLALACITVSQFFGVNISIEQQFVVVVMSTLATLGTVVVPGGGLVALAIVLPSIGLPIEGVALLSGIDWFSGMFRTTLNVIDDVLVALVIAKQENELDYDTFESTGNPALSN